MRASHPLGRALALSALLVGAVAFGPAQATEPEASRVISPPGAVSNGYFVQPPLGLGGIEARAFVRQNGTLVHNDFDHIAPHDVVSEATTTDRRTWDERYCTTPPGWQPGEHISDAWMAENPCRLFWSPLIYPLDGNTTIEAEVFISMPDGTPKLEVSDLNNLETTGYRFFCTLHPDTMFGRLIVLPPN